MEVLEKETNNAVMSPSGGNWPVIKKDTHFIATEERGHR